MSKDKSSKKEHKKSRDEKASSPVAGDAKVKKEKKDKKDKKSKRSTSPSVLLDAVVKTDADVDPMKMEVDSDGKILGGTMENAVVVKADGEEVQGALVPFAKPLAEGKLAKKVLKTVKKAAKTKSLKRGVKEVVKSLRKSPLQSVSATSDPLKTPLLILAGDISPPDVISHLPVLAEDHGVPYVFVTSRAELGAAGATKRPTSVVMIMPEGAAMGRKKKTTGKDGEDKDKLKKIKEDEEDFQKSFGELVKEVQEVTRTLLV